MASNNVTRKTASPSIGSVSTETTEYKGKLCDTGSASLEKAWIPQGQ
jgi:hypothetical protein